MSDPQFESLLNKVATVYRPTSNATPNSFGEREVTPGTAIHTNLPVCLQPNKEKFELESNGYKYLVELVVYTTFVDIQENDRMEISGQVYTVVGVEDEGGQGHHLKLFVVKQ